MRISSPADNENPVRYIVQELGRTSRPWRALATLVADHPQWFHTHAWWENPQTWWPASTLLARKISSRPQHISRKILTIPPNLQSSTRKALPLFGVDLVLDGHFYVQRQIKPTRENKIKRPKALMFFLERQWLQTFDSLHSTPAHMARPDFFEMVHGLSQWGPQYRSEIHRWYTKVGTYSSGNPAAHWWAHVLEGGHVELPQDIRVSHRATLLECVEHWEKSGLASIYGWGRFAASFHPSHALAVKAALDTLSPLQRQ